MPVDVGNLDMVLGKIRTEYGASSVHSGSAKESLDRIPTGDLMLDWATGGGMPIGRMGHWFGHYSSCKSLVLWNTIRNAQEMGLRCAYYNVENQYLESWVRAQGVDTDALEVVEGTTIEDLGKKLEALLGVVHFHGIDSLAAAVSQDELAGDVGDWHPGLAARAWGKVFRRANERFSDTQNCIVFINQLRTVFGRGAEEAPPGGRMVDFASSLTLKFRRSHWLFRNPKTGVLDIADQKIDTMSGDKDPDGMEFQVRVEKSRVGPPLRSARMRLDFETGHFDELYSLTKAAKWFGLARKSGEKSTWYELPGGGKAQGEPGLRQHIAENPDFAEEIRAKVAEVT